MESAPVGEGSRRGIFLASFQAPALFGSCRDYFPRPKRSGSIRGGSSAGGQFLSLARLPKLGLEAADLMQTSGPVERRTAGDNFDDFIEEHFATAYRFAFCLGLAHDRATRMVEATFDAAELRRADENRKLDKMWVLETLHRKWRACHPARFDPDEDEGHGNTEGPLIRIRDAAQMDCDKVLKTLHSMRPAHRLPLSLFYFEQLSHGEIARILELPADTARSRLAAAKVSLRQMLEQTRHSPAVSADQGG